jgi:hypothetical protein
LIVPGLLAYIGYVSQHSLAALADHGVVSVGTVVERRPPYKKSLPQLVYEYQVGDKTYRVSESREKGDWENTLPGAKADVRYLPEDPGNAYTERDFQKAHGSAPTALACWFMAALLFVICGPLWLYVHVKFGRIRELARSGMPTAGVVTDIGRYGPSTYDQWRVRYAFAGADGSTRQGTTYLYGNDAKKLGGAGKFATVLVDPNNEKRFELYPTVASLYTIVDAG